MVVNGQGHAPVALPPRERILVTIEQETWVGFQRRSRAFGKEKNLTRTTDRPVRVHSVTLTQI